MAEYIKDKTSKGEVRWRVRVVTGHDENGRPKCKMRTFKTRKEGEVWARDEETRVAQHLSTDPGKLTVGAYLTDWLTEWKDHVRPSTLAGYTKLIELYVRPRLNGLLMRDASAQALQRLLNDLPTPATKAHTRRVLHVAFERAAQLGLVPFNYVDRTKTPPRQARQGVAWTKAQARRFLAIADGDHYQPYWTLALCTGMRPSELLGLHWSAIDLDVGTLAVEEARPTVGNLTFEGDPKSHAGKRSLTLAPEVVSLLRAHKARQNMLRLKAGPSWQDHNLVCASAVGTPVELRNIAHRFITLCKRAGVERIRPYDLRHTAISLMAEAGDDLKAISEVVGHSDPRLTARVYQHAYEHQRTKALAGLAAGLLAGPDTPEKAM